MVSLPFFVLENFVKAMHFAVNFVKFMRDDGIKSAVVVLIMAIEGISYKIG